MKLSNKKEIELAEKYLEDRGFRKEEGFAINTEEMNSEGHEEIFFAGEVLEKAISDYVRRVKYWVYEPSNGEQVMEDIWDAVEYAEEDSVLSFEDFKNKEVKRE